MKHGTLTGYDRGCRCEACRHTQSDYAAARNAGLRVDHKLLGDLLHELFPDGLTDDCPARRQKATA